MFDPVGQDGHTLFSNGFKWLLEMDAFLRFRDLPTWRREDVNALINRLDVEERNRDFLEGFVAAPFEKALARASGGLPNVFGAWGYDTIAKARDIAVSNCQRQRPQAQCLIVLENDRWVGPQVAFAQNDPWLGMWQLNLAQSKIQPSPTA